MRSTRRILAPAILAAVLAAAGCGGDDDEGKESAAGTTTPSARTATAPSATAPSTVPPATTQAEPAGPSPGTVATAGDRRQIERIVRSSLLPRTPKQSCGALSARLKKRLFDSQARCLRIARGDEDKPGEGGGAQGEDDVDIERIAIVGVTVDGRKGTARVRATGNGLDAAGRVSVLRERGRWLVHGYEADFLRGLIIDFSTGGDAGTPRIASCFEGLLAKRSDAQVQGLYYDGIGNRKRRELSDDLVACTVKDPKAVRKQYEDIFLESAQLPAQAKRCLVAGLQERAPDSLFVQLFKDESAGRKNSAASRRLQSVFRQVVRDCAGTSGPNIDRG